MQIQAIKLQPENPFTWASGIKSPIYCDNRKILSYPPVRTFIRQELVKTLEENFGMPDVIAGVATGGIAIGALVAQELGLPFIYVRSKSKEHGLQNAIEGHISKNQQVIIIEDLISTGGSSLKAAEAVREADCSVKGMISIFTYGLEIAKENFMKHKVPLVSLADYDTLLKHASETGYIQKHQIKSLNEWRENPEKWLQHA